MHLINEKAFQNIETLKLIDLSHNFLEKIDSCIFTGTNCIEHINLWKNSLTHLDEKTFHGMHHLKDIDLSRNKILKLSSLTFCGLENLEKIYLHDNEFNSGTLELCLEESVKFVSFKKNYQQNDIKSIVISFK